MAGNICDVCGHQREIRAVCSVLGPISFAYCSQCLKAHAEPKWILEATIDICGGPEHVAPWVWTLTYYEDGQYQSATELRKTMK